MVDWLESLSRIFIGAFLLTAAIAKWRLGPDAFAAAIEGYRIVPRALGPSLARAITAAEFVLGAAMLLGLATSLVAVAVGFLLLAFAVAMAAALAYGARGDCGCGAFFRRQRLTWRLVYRNLAIVAFLVPTASGPWEAPLLASGLIAAATVLLVVHRWSALTKRAQVDSMGGV